MEKPELNMLQIIHDHPNISQREISSEVGMSLGNVNILIKKFIHTGLLKAERINGNSVKYMLTPNGFAYLSKKTIQFVARSYQAVLKIQSQMLEVVQGHYKKGDTVVIKGESNEVMDILLQLLHQAGYKADFYATDDNHSNYVQWDDPNGDGIYLLEGYFGEVMNNS